VAARDCLAAPRVVAVAHDVPLPAYDDAIPATPKDPDRVVELSERWGLDRPRNRVLTTFGTAGAHRSPGGCHAPTSHSCGSMAPRFLTTLNVPFCDRAMYMFNRRWC
jgi:hypothetical protein